MGNWLITSVAAGGMVLDNDASWKLLSAVKFRPTRVVV